MRGPIAFYAPLKPPDHPVPSGDRRMARSLMRLLEGTGREVVLASRFRAYDGVGDPGRQERLQATGERLAARLIRRFAAWTGESRPAVWITYHVYHKAPDHLGPDVARALGIPYLIVEASLAPKRASGPWRIGYAASLRAIRRADGVLAMSEVDAAGLQPVVVPPAMLGRLMPFTDPAPLTAARDARQSHRRRLGQRHGLASNTPWLLAAAMMRPDAKLESYRLLAPALGVLGDRPWQLLLAGDGPARGEVEAAFAPLGSDRVRLLGFVPPDELPGVMAAADLFVWPAVREAYGLAMLEAAGCGCPVVAGRHGGVAEVVRDGRTGLLVEPDDPAALAAAIGALLDDPARRRTLGTAAATFVAAERSTTVASGALDAAIAMAAAAHAARTCTPS